MNGNGAYFDQTLPVGNSLSSQGYLRQAQFKKRQYQRRPPLSIDGVFMRQAAPRQNTVNRRSYINYPTFSEQTTVVGSPAPSLPEAVPKEQSFSASHRLRFALVGMAFVVFGLGMFVIVQALQTNHSAESQVAALNQSSSGGSTPPSQQKPTNSALATYQVAPSLPKFLKIDKLGINTRILQTSVTNSGELGSPSNIYDTDWYSGSAHPGDPASQGAMLIDGHVHGPTLPGVFANIKSLQPGDAIQVVRGDDKVFNYQVVSVQNFDASTLNMAQMLQSSKAGKAGLNLMTCGGLYSPKAHEYLQRTVVFAVQQ